MSHRTTIQRRAAPRPARTTRTRSAADNARSLGRLSLLRAGAQGTQVRLLTAKLAKAGYLPKAQDKFDSSVETAVRRYQKEKGLLVDGIVGQQTWGSFFGVKVRPGSDLLRGAGGTSAPASGAQGRSHTHGPRGSSGVSGSQSRSHTHAPRGSSGTQAPRDDAPTTGGKRVTAYINGRAQQISVVPVGNGQYMRADAAQQYKRMVADAGRAGVNLSSTSGFRTMAEQQVLWNRYGAGRAARPGYSNHQNGISMDIGGVNGYGTAAFNWLRNNASKYGFRNDVRGEFWHWTYYGR